ncbi:MAG TPA: NRDE family protein [Syntrophales bacterium]|nr:NRDE family protein [Syntrophales bacterium]HPQ44638.1 NRDE family protein [Syntrophales bacterium]
MCLILFSYWSHQKYPLILAANRDEFYERPTAQASFWEETPHMLAGKDLKDGGTWIGITKTGRMAAITNFRDIRNLKSDAPSRGNLVSGFLRSDEDPVEYIHRIKKVADKYNGFSLILGDSNGLFYFSNTDGYFYEISPGMHGLSNHLLDTPWPKVERGKKLLTGLTSNGRNPSPDEVFHILADTFRPADRYLPDTGIGLEWERLLSSLFIHSEIYGTRSSTLILVDRDNNVTFIERSYVEGPGEYKTVNYEFRSHPGLFEGGSLHVRNDMNGKKDEK